MKKGKVNLHKSEVAALFVGTHVELAIYEREELNSLDADVDAKLKKAGGANYDLGSNAGGSYQSNAGHIKNSATWDTTFSNEFHGLTLCMFFCKFSQNIINYSFIFCAFS